MHSSYIGSGTLIKYVQQWDVIICKFIDAIKSTKVELHKLYVDLFYKYDDSNFNEFIVICEHHSE
jgi:hypothetical protein